jgi:hypothetical protein
VVAGDKAFFKSNLDRFDFQPSLRDWSRYLHGWSLFSKRCPNQPIEFKTFDLKGTLGLEVTGTIAATRITVD